MTAAPLTDEEIAYVIDRFLASHPWVEARIQSASGAAEAADVARAELRNSGFSHLVDFGTTCPACGRARRPLTSELRPAVHVQTCSFPLGHPTAVADDAVPRSSAATAESICLYLTDLAERGRAVSTLERRVAALKLAHRTAGVEPSPTEDVAVRQVMRGIRRTIGIAPRRQASPLVIQQLRVLLAANPDETLQDVQDYALLLLGFAFAGRASDLVSLDVADLEFTDRGLRVGL